MVVGINFHVNNIFQAVMMNLQHPQQPTLCPRLTKNQKPTFKGWMIPKKEAHYHEKETFSRILAITGTNSNVGNMFRGTIIFFIVRFSFWIFHLQLKKY